jgi:glutamate decarboxylase
MSLHKKNDLGRKVLDVIDRSGDVPKYKMPRDERLPRDAFALVHDELLLDGNAR